MLAVRRWSTVRRVVDLRRAPGEEVPILGEGALNQLIEHIVGRVADELCIGTECVAMRLEQATDVAHGTDTIRARLDQWHGAPLLSDGSTRQIDCTAERVLLVSDLVTAR